MSDFEQDITSIISRQLDGNLNAGDIERLQEWIKASPDNARTFVEFSLLHDRLRIENALLAGNYPEEKIERPLESSSSTPLTKSRQSIRWALGVMASTAALLLVSFLVFQALQGSPVVAADTVLERLISTAKIPADRTYLVTAIEKELRGGGRRGKRHPNQGKSAVERRPKDKAPVDGAVLHVRGTNEYVLIRRFDNDDEFITGCDGETSWSIAPRKGKVRVSQDLTRFRGGMPGGQHSIPFINIYDDLQNIREAYEISWLDSKIGSKTKSKSQSPDLACLIANKKSPEHRGAKYVEIWFDLKSGVIHELFLDKLGRFKDGPQSILLQLIDESSLPEDFFKHSSHHSSGREVVLERE